mmetsp:Transcript_15028/g.17359  ORF Transcript_15028/g.17359 Transcript_15028/m.17359 type:complete len:159 (-) Transcript_15028:556-1032(-)
MGTLFVLLIVLAGLLTSVLMPHRNNMVHLTSGRGSARVVYEDNGMPHIYADNREIGAFTIGYITAADRLWQIEYLRRLAQGHMSEILGSVAVELDEAMRILSLDNTCNISRDSFATEGAYDYYESYAEGINEYVKRNTLPIQFQVFWLEFKPWTVHDS